MKQGGRWIPPRGPRCWAGCRQARKDFPLKSWSSAARCGIAAGVPQRELPLVAPCSPPVAKPLPSFPRLPALQPSLGHSSLCWPMLELSCPSPGGPLVGRKGSHQACAQAPRPRPPERAFPTHAQTGPSKAPKAQEIKAMSCFPDPQDQRRPC